MQRLLLTAAAFFAFRCASAHPQWEMQDAHVAADLRGIDYVGNGIAWASGSHGTVLRTEDMGFVWQLCATPPGAADLDFRGVQAFDNETAIVMSSGPGDKSRLYKTTDGCQTWKLVLTNPDKDGFWDAIRFDDRNLGWLLGDPVGGQFCLYFTSDSGLHWVQQKNKRLQANAGESGAFAASNSSLYSDASWLLFGMGGTAGAWVFDLAEVTICLDDCPPSQQNLDGSKNEWVKIPLPIGDNGRGSGVFSLSGHRHSRLSPKGDSTIVAVGGDYTQAAVRERSAAVSFDGGRHWTSATAQPGGYRSAVAYESAANAWITVGPNGTDISTDDGRNWRPLRPGPSDAPNADKNWNALSLPFVVGPKGRIGILRDAALREAAGKAETTSAEDAEASPH